MISIKPEESNGYIKEIYNIGRLKKRKTLCRQVALPPGKAALVLQFFLWEDLRTQKTSVLLSPV